MPDRKKWFKAKRYGWGWTPATWQGWAVLGAYIFLCVVAALYLVPKRGEELGFVYMAVFFLFFISLTSFLIGISYRTGETPKWQWGGKEYKDNKSEEHDR